IQLKTFLFSAVDNLGIRLSREQVKAVQTKCTQLDGAIIENALKLDLTVTEVDEMDDSGVMVEILNSLTEITNLLKSPDSKSVKEVSSKKSTKKPAKDKVVRTQTVGVTSTSDIDKVKIEDLDALVK